MMVLYSGTTCPFSQRCRFVLFEKGMDFEIRDVDLFNKPEDINTMNPYGQVPILVERDLMLYESNIINEYIDERFPHPQLMPADPVMRARTRLFLFNFERELFVHVQTLENSNNQKAMEKGARDDSRPVDAAVADHAEEQVHARRRFFDARRCAGAVVMAARPLRHRSAEDRRAADEIRRTHVFATGLY